MTYTKADAQLLAAETSAQARLDYETARFCNIEAERERFYGWAAANQIDAADLYARARGEL
jgi:hypothetical protein